MKMRQNNAASSFVVAIAAVLLLLASGCKSKKQVPLKENEFYVCSMDPQVMEKEPGLCPICKMELTKAVVDMSNSSHVVLNIEQVRLANIKVAPARVMKQSVGARLNGVFAINQDKIENISARIGGRVDKLYFQIEGTEVRKGDKIYELYSRELMQVQEEYLLAIEKEKLLKTVGQALVKAVRNKLVLWGLNDLQIAALEQTGKPRITNSIYSKVSGTVIGVSIKEGDYVQEGAEIYKVADLKTLWVEAQVYTSDVVSLKEGTVVKVIPEQAEEEVLEGKVLFANPELQPDSKINLVRIEVTNPYGRYRPGMQVYVTLAASDGAVLSVPIHSVIPNAHNSVVWVQTGENTYEPRMVVIGKETGEQVEIVSGIDEGDTVVTSGAYLLNSEYILKRGKNPMANSGHEGMKM